MQSSRSIMTAEKSAPLAMLFSRARPCFYALSLPSSPDCATLGATSGHFPAEIFCGATGAAGSDPERKDSGHQGRKPCV